MNVDLFSRNIGFISTEEQKQLEKSTIAIAGAGGIGGLLAERLIRIGIGCIKISDPGLFEPSNTNRQYMCNATTLNKNKAEVVAEDLKKINPEAHIIVDSKGITTQKSADDFVGGATIVIDEMDYGLFKENIYLQRAARKNGIFYIFSVALGFGALVANFAPDGITLEEYNGFAKDIDLDKIHQIKISQNKILPNQPSYMHGKEKAIQMMIDKEIPISTNSIGVGLSSIITANEAVNLILKKTKPNFAPKYIHIDFIDNSINGCSFHGVT